jgi:hypothetical protein
MSDVQHLVTVTDLDEDLRAAVDQYVTERGRLEDPWEAMNQCYDESCEFLEILETHGVTASMISGKRRFPGWPDGAGHHAVLVRGLVVDWTYRQFVDRAPVPYIVTEEQWRQDWSNVTVGYLGQEGL